MSALESKSMAYELHRPVPARESHGLEENKESGVHTGTGQDAVDMARLGRKQEFRRNFHSWAVVGLSSVIMATWVALLGSASFSLIDGGYAGTVYTYIAVWLLTIPVTLSLAEMASMAPTSGGQYHWTSEFAPPGSQRFLSYIVGWLSSLGWQAAIATTAYGAGNVILQMGAISYPSYVPTKWHATLMTMGVTLLSVFFNTLGARHLPLFESLILVLHIVGFFAVIITLGVLAPKAPAEQVFTEFSNFGGWTSVGGACVVGMLTATGSLGGSDSPAHLAEEVRNASVVVPRMMITTIILNGILGLAMIIMFCFCITDIQSQIWLSTSAFPYVDVFLAATNSKGGTIALVSIIAALNICANLSVVAAGSRQTWAFARDNGLPFSSTLRKITTIGTPIPLYSVFASLIITVVVSLLNLAGSTAFNSVVGLLSGSGGVSYSISISCVLWKRITGQPLPHAPFRLGIWGIPINVIAIAYCIVLTTMSFFPMFAAVSVETMNWGIAMFGGATILCMVYYFVWGNKFYQPPAVHLNKN
ncbi:amino acid transporter [Hortaea werneckii]|nr:amino acid transporter [Hortaea werneckii]KAI7025404.1 amino acid transporter [Hortaea werneckii]KAI7675975.1 amino acid transporter [Hortaea werneckii]